MNLLLTCHYCDFKWNLQVYTTFRAENAECPRCGDKNKSIKDIDKNKIDTYKGSPAFEPKIIDWGYIITSQN